MSSYAITGASKGIGREFVRQLAADSTNTVLAIVRNPESANISNLASKHSNVHIIKGDVTDPNSILEAATAAAAITDGKLDVLIHNSNAVDMDSMASTPSQLPFDAQAIQNIFSPSLNTAIYGGIWATNAFLPLIEKGAQKKIVHISSGMADVDLINKAGVSSGVAYSIAKAGLNVTVAKYAAELAPRGIKVLALSPGWVDTWEVGDTGEKPAGVVHANELLLKMFQLVEPELKGQIQPEESVRKCLQVIENLDAGSSGLFIECGTSEAVPALAALAYLIDSLRSMIPHFLGHGLFSLNYSLIFIASRCARLGRPQNWAQKVKPEADVVTVNRTRLEIDSSIKPTCITLVTKRMNLPLSKYNERRRIFLFSCCPLAQTLKPMHKAREAPSTQPRVEISKEPVAPLQIPSSGML
ncbi:NAD(P)-binding protein [Aspergillus costaricaensis CBS 115574]|uniref:NAD(P)-binding protein n=1 Tax=Aspergillus costaricaensis CBS 115574 TaxID=1448317 RepID=A0ACD1I0W4_9EURO|nr:NAD(P)-binding protein [Aspergillus costaricaensis CBS 115574]RAK83937.1 NAD(P)-binding protein [Aspergillus costaricaensis CBS 115574]